MLTNKKCLVPFYYHYCWNVGGQLSKRNTVSWNGKPKGALAIHKEESNLCLKRIEHNAGEIKCQPTHISKGVKGENRTMPTQKNVTCSESILINKV